MNTGENSTVTILRILVIAAVAGGAIFLLFRVPKLIFRKPVASGQASCKKDVTYYYKDPQNHPYDC